jgi:hypothetical protein
MRRYTLSAIAVLAGLVASVGPASAAEPVETAITEWIAKFDGAPDWSARFDDLTYDKETDTAILTGLKVAYTATDLTLSFKPIAIVGYAEAADGTFGVDVLTTDGVKATGDGFDAALTDVRYKSLGNLTDDFEELIDWDPQRPFTSLMRSYARFLDIRLEHASIGSMSMTAENNGEQVLVSYEDIALEDWADGKIASITTGPLTMASAGVAEPFSITGAGTEARKIDYAAMLRIYDPDQYVGGVGDGIWRNAAEFVGYDTIVFDTPEARVTFGKVSMEDFRVRQPERSFNDFFDRAMLTPHVQAEPTPEEMRSIVGSLSSFAFGAMSLEDIAVEGRDGGTGRLGEMRLVDVSAEGIGEFSFNDINVSPPDQGNLIVGRIAFGGIVFPPLQALIEAAEAEQTGEDFDYARLTTRLAFFEASDIDVDVPDRPRVRLDKARLNLGNYVGPIPTVMALEIAGTDLPVEAIEEPKARAIWKALGYDRVRGDFGARLAWNESDESITIEDFRFALEDVGALSLSAVLNGLSREALADLEGLPEALAGLSFVRGTLSLENYDILNRWVDRQAALTGDEPLALRQRIAVMLAEITSDVGNAGFQQQLRQVLEASIMVPGSVTATAMPSTPVPLVALGVLAQSAPASLPDLLGLTIASTSAR